MFDSGDPVPLSVTITNEAGVPQDATLVVLTVTLPDGTTSTPTVTAAGSGVYTATGPSTQAGRYGVRWVATGTNASAYTDAYDVDDVNPTTIASLADVKQRLNITSTSKDEELRRIMRGATAFFERRLGPVVRQSVTQTAVVPERDGTLFLDGPVISLTSITDTYGYGSVYNVANYLPVGSTATPLAYVSTGYRYPVTVAYVGGWSEIPGDLHDAFLDYVAWKWEGQRGPGVEPGAQGSVDEFALGTPATVPFQILEVINGYSAPVVA